MATRDDNNPPWRDPGDLSPVWRVARHPFIVLVALVACLGAAWKYVRTVTPQYVSTAVLRVQQPAPQIFGAPEPSHSPDENAVFLNAELSVLTSTGILETAMAEPAFRQTGTYRLISLAPDPFVELRKKLRGTVGRKDNLISLEFESPSAADAAAVVNGVVDAYAARQSHQKNDAQEKMLAALQGQHAAYDAQVKQTGERMLDALRKAGAPALDSRQEKLIELSALRTALRAAEQEELTARTQYDEATAALGADGAAKAELARINAAGTAATRTDAEAAQLRFAISELEAKRQSLVTIQNLIPTHPQVVAADKQIADAKLQYAASAYRRLKQLEQRSEGLRVTLREQDAVVIDLATRAAEYAQAELTLKRLDEKLASLDGRIAEIKAGEGASGVRIEFVERGRIAARPAKPDVPRTYAVAGGVGLLLGASLALARDASQRRRRARAEVSSEPVVRRMTPRRGELAEEPRPGPRLGNEDPPPSGGEPARLPVPPIRRGQTASGWGAELEPRGRRQAD